MMRSIAVAGVLLWGMLQLTGQTPISTSQESVPLLRTVHGLVLGLDGKPVAHRSVHLIGLSRGSMRPYSDNPSISIPHWDFLTDDQGRFDAPLGDFKTWQDKEDRPGWGTYALFVDPSPQDAGAVSQRFFHFAESDSAASQLKSDDEWGAFLNLPPQGLSITLQIQSGITLQGQIWDYTHPNRPFSGIKVSAYNDLHAGSHTGYGGALFQQEAVTDAQGRFVIEHIFPVKFYVSLDGVYNEDNGAYWLKTKIGGQWHETVGDEIAPKPDDKVVHLELMGREGCRLSVLRQGGGRKRPTDFRGQSHLRNVVP